FLSRSKHTLVIQTLEGTAIISITSARSKFYFQPYLGSAFYRFVAHAFCAPINLLEQFAVRFLDSNQVIPSIVAWTEHNPILTRAYQFNSFGKVFGGHCWTVRIDQTHRFKTAREQILDREIETLTELVTALRHQTEIGRQ